LSQPLSFQEVILRLQEFWADQGCIIWQPYNVQVGAGTMNPATVLRVLGPETWNVAYVEPSVRPDDGRFGENPNRMQVHYQFQVILKPDPGNPQEIYLQSLEALGIDRRRHDIRFVEDNWQSPALGAWGLGWEVWLDGQEITQFTYFQQAGGMELDPVSVEITYGLERIVLALQGVDAVWDIHWGGDFSYGDVLLQSEIEHCQYYFNVADVDALRATFEVYEAETKRALAQDPPLVMPAHDYVLKCSHLFNVMDTRGAIGVTERQAYFGRMRALAREVATAYVGQRERLGFPFGRADAEHASPAPEPGPPDGSAPGHPAPFLLEIGTEELPATDLDAALEQLREAAAQMLEEVALPYDVLRVYGTPRRLALHVESLAPRQQDEEREEKGPPTSAAFDADGKPTRAAEGFARKHGLDVSALERREMDGGEYVVASVKIEGRPAADVLAERLPDLVASLGFEQNMRWNASGVRFSRPVRWLVSLYGGMTVPFAYAGLVAGRTTRGTRPERSPEIELKDVKAYFKAMDEAGIVLDREARREAVRQQVEALAEQAGGIVPDDPGLLDEVSNLIERPTALLGHFDEASLNLPRDVLVTVMKKHQRYFAIEKKGALLPAFVAVRNGDAEHLDEVVTGNEHVIRARFKDADFFYQADVAQPLESYLPGLDTLTFQEALGSMLDKARRVEELTGELGRLLGLSKTDLKTAQRTAHLCKADLATQMVVEFTSLQGVMGREYGRLSGEPGAVAEAIYEHYLPRGAGDALPASQPGLVVGLADRLDSLVGLFAVGLAPTGARDPYGLRRAALGLLQNALGHELSLDLCEAVRLAAGAQPVPVGDEAQAAVLDFIAGRLRVLLRDTYRYDVVDAVLAEQAHDPQHAALSVAQLEKWVARDDWEPILDAYARCVRIVRDRPERYTLDTANFVAPVEHDLHQAYQKALKARGDAPDVEAMLTAFEPMVPAITAFFATADEGGVMVMDEDLTLRENRLALLQHVAALADGVADFSLLENF